MVADELTLEKLHGEDLRVDYQIVIWIIKVCPLSDIGSRLALVEIEEDLAFLEASDHALEHCFIDAKLFCDILWPVAVRNAGRTQVYVTKVELLDVLRPLVQSVAEVLRLDLRLCGGDDERSPLALLAVNEGLLQVVERFTFVQA